MCVKFNKKGLLMFVKNLIMLNVLCGMLFFIPAFAMVQQPAVDGCVACLPARSGEIKAPENTSGICSINYSDFTICQTDYWKLILNPNQHYLGRSLLVLRRHASSLENLTCFEETEHSQMQRVIVSVLKNTFACETVNLLYAINHEFKKKPINPHVYWHFIPRYGREIYLNEHIFSDTEWTNMVDFSRDDNYSFQIQPFHKSIMAYVAVALQKELKENNIAISPEFIVEHYR
jgi:diadenosine tetraphosphate (Ap4A) HIT family hydrolase